MTPQIRHALRVTWIAKFGEDGFEAAGAEKQEEFAESLLAPNDLLSELKFVEKGETM